MKNIAFILALLIFNQSVSACGPSFIASHQKEVIDKCSVDLSPQSDEKKHSCCTKTHNSDNNNDPDGEGGCSDACKCLCHAKIFIGEFSIIRKPEFLVKAVAEKNILPVFVHSYDFHPSVSYPPQV